MGQRFEQVIHSKNINSLIEVLLTFNKQHIQVFTVYDLIILYTYMHEMMAVSLVQSHL